MKSVHFKNANDAKATNPKKDKPIKPVNKKPTVDVEESKIADQAKRDDSEWVPSRDWHTYLSSQQTDDPKLFPWEGSRKDDLNANAEDLMLTKPTDRLVDIKLPTVNFCSKDRITPRQQNVTISDLGDGDKSRIAQLVQELARCKQEKQEDDETILMLKNKVTELKTSMRKLLSNRSPETKISKIQSKNEVEQQALKNQLSELNRLIYQTQVQKANTEVQLRTIATQAEKMTKIIHEMHRENTDLQVELRVTKERLSVAQNAVEKITKDLQSVQNQMKPTMEDKACQSVEDLGSVSVQTEQQTNGNKFKFGTNNSDVIPEDQRILCELFFNKSMQNEFAPKETVIILPSDSIPFFTKD
ncbi:uncharacterized protein LOC129005496 [Macrosteles quadrilineatus]|uniref:uncharacterized protein LOC129005496 n=1 Tax=Macrosteles quadrilineatus TaxID=74068 RepID=UPI0023E18A7B|nr:uncharacterized protein LOC129005496 [Macrosteles quadrilineatus]